MEKRTLAWWNTKPVDDEKAKQNDLSFWINKLLENSVDSRLWYLKTDVKMRVKLLIIRDEGVQDLMNLWKRLNIIKKDLGESMGGILIQEAIQELVDEFNEDNTFAQKIERKIEELKMNLNDKNIVPL